MSTKGMKLLLLLSLLLLHNVPGDEVSWVQAKRNPGPGESQGI